MVFFIFFAEFPLKGSETKGLLKQAGIDDLRHFSTLNIAIL